MNIKKLFICFIIISILLTCVVSCNSNDSPPMENLIKYICRQEYVRIYGMLTPESKQNITIDELTTRFEDIYSEMGIKSIEGFVTDVETVDESSIVKYDLNFDTTKFDVFTLSYELNFEKISGSWKIKYFPSMIIPNLRENEKVLITNVAPIRGEIFDKNGDILTKNDYAISIYANVDKIKDGDAFVRIVAPLLGVTETFVKNKIQTFYDRLYADTADLENDYKSNAEIVILKTYSKFDGIPSYVESELLQIKGIGIDTTTYTKVRTYPNGQLLSHVLGYTGVMNHEESQKSENIALPSDAIVGKDGLEKSYDLTLRGEYGYKMEIIDPQGKIGDTPVYKKPVNGSDLRLCIDINTQIETEILLMENLNNEMAGAVVVIDPLTGKVKALASYPTYDPNIFTFGISTETWDNLTSEESRNPLYNRATIGLYPPGSSFKPFTAAIAMDTNTLPYDFVIKEYIHNNKWTPSNPGWVYPPITRFSETNGPLNLRNAMINSDNIYFAYAALEVGAETFYEKMVDYGFNEPIVSDVAIGRPQITDNDYFNKLNLLADTGYGQGQLLISPLQMASMFSAFANNGDVMQPYIVENISAFVNGDYAETYTAQPTVWKSEIITPYVLTKIESLLREVVDIGTAKSVRIRGKNIYGKTGTAEIGNDKSREIAWFIGYTYFPEPLLVCVTLEVPSQQGAVRYEIAKQLLDDE